MLLRELYRSVKMSVNEGGNLSSDSPGWTGDQGHQADEINLQVNNRSHMVGVVNQLLHSVNNAFAEQHQYGIWNPQLLASGQFLGGSSLHFLNTKDISDEQFVQLRPKVGDIDTQVDKKLEQQVHAFLQSHVNKPIGNSMLLGFSQGNEQYNALFQLSDPPVKLQIDFEFGKYDEATGTPDEWFRFSHSSDWKDIQAGVKGVFHKYLYRSLSGLSSRQFYVAKMAGRGKARAIQISDTPETDSTTSFAVSSSQGGGVSQKYQPYIDPATDQPMVKDGLPVMEPVEAKNRNYVQILKEQFKLLFGVDPTSEDLELQQSFIGTLDLVNKYVDQTKKANIVERFLDICFEVGSQMITKDDPARDAQTKFAAIDIMLEKLDMTNMRPRAVEMAKIYEDDFLEVEAYKKANPNERQPRAALKKAKALQSLQEAEDAVVKAQLRKGMPHLHDLKSSDFLDLLDEIHDGNGSFKLQNIPLNVKVDGFGGRFGKNAQGKPFMGTSRTEPRYEAGFLDYHEKKGTTDQGILTRAQMFDDLFYQMMNAVDLVDNKLGQDFLVNKQVTCEVLYLPFAEETEQGKLKFVGIQYNKLPQGVQLALVPFHIVDATTGEQLPDANQYINKLLSVGQQGSVMFINNRLTQNQALDVTALVPPLQNIEQFKAMLASKKRDQVAAVKTALEPVKVALEKAIISDPNIIGKNMLGQDYEGIVINSRLGPIKVTSQEQRDIITAKNDAIAAARTERPRSETKTAVVAIGSFVGHKGHEQLFNYTIDKAKELNGDPYLFIGNAEGKDDPIPPSVKVQTWHKMYPQYAKNISTVTQQGGSLIQKIKHELINPLPGKAPRYDNIVIMVGEDRKGLSMPQGLMKAVNKFQGYEHVKVSLDVTPRGTGIRFTDLRNVLKDPNMSPQQQLAVWSKAFDINKLGTAWISHLMDLTREGMGIATKPQPAHRSDKVAKEGLLSLLSKEVPKAAKPTTSLSDVRSAVAADKALSDAIPPPHIRMYLQRIKDAKDKGVSPQFSPGEYQTLQNYIKQQQMYRENKVKYANKVIRDMRAYQFIREHGGTQKMHSHHKAAIKNASTFPAMNQSTGSAYMGYRMGVALAGAPDFPTKIEADNWIGGDPLLAPYTNEENDMINAAAKQVGGGQRQTWSNNRSLETADTNKTSAVAKIKRNKYGI